MGKRTELSVFQHTVQKRHDISACSIQVCRALRSYYTILCAKVQWEQSEKIHSETAWGQNRSRALPGYTILYGKVQWEQSEKIHSETAWGQNRSRALPGYTVLYGKAQWEREKKVSV